MKREPGFLLVLTGPSGTGKTSLCRRITEEFQDVQFSVSYTTRPARVGEENGRDYFFVDTPTFEQMTESGAFAETAIVHGNRYGTSRQFLTEKVAEGKIILLDIDPQGAHQLKGQFPEAVFVFFIAPSFDELRQRLVGRGTDSMDTINRRLARARSEVQECTWYDYVIVNDDFDRALSRFMSIIIAERCRTNRSGDTISRLFSRYGLEEQG